MTAKPHQSIDVAWLLLHLAEGSIVGQDERSALQAVADMALRAVPDAEVCVLHALDATFPRLIPVAWAGALPGYGAPPVISAGGGAAGRAMSGQAAITVDDTMVESGWAPSPAGSAARSFVVHPVSDGTSGLGTLCLASTRPHAALSQEGSALPLLVACATLALRQQQCATRIVTQEALLGALMESSRDGLLVLDSNSIVTRANAAVRSLLDLPDLERNLPCTASEESRCPASLRAVLGANAGGNQDQDAITLTLPSGRQASLQVARAPLPSPPGGALLTVHDVSVERGAETERAIQLSQVAHELRTPLQHIRGYASLIGDFDDLPREDYVRFVGQIQDEASHLARLVDDLMDLGRIARGSLPIRPELVRLDHLVESTLCKAELRVAEKGLTLSYRPPEAPIHTVTDPLRVEQVLANIVDNAIKFVPAGGRIDVTVARRGPEAEVSVSDTGPGIPAEALARVFDRFYQVRDPARRELGIGLGLYICREIMHALGGEIYATSTVGVGSVFSFRLPLRGEPSTA